MSLELTNMEQQSLMALVVRVLNRTVVPSRRNTPRMTWTMVIRVWKGSIWKRSRVWLKPVWMKSTSMPSPCGMKPKRERKRWRPRRMKVMKALLPVRASAKNDASNENSAKVMKRPRSLRWISVIWDVRGEKKERQVEGFLWKDLRHVIPIVSCFCFFPPRLIWHCHGTSGWEDIRDTDINHFMNMHFRSVWWRGKFGLMSVWLISFKCQNIGWNFIDFIWAFLKFILLLWRNFRFKKPFQTRLTFSVIGAWYSWTSICWRTSCCGFCGSFTWFSTERMIWTMNSKPSVKKSKKHRRRSEPVS